VSIRPILSKASQAAEDMAIQESQSVAKLDDFSEQPKPRVRYLAWIRLLLVPLLILLIPALLMRGAIWLWGNFVAWVENLVTDEER